MNLMNSIHLILIWGLCLGSVNCIIPNVKGFKDKESEEPGHLSLPPLFDLNDISEIDLNWDTFSDIKLDSGRLLVGPGRGSLWSKPHLANTENEWTIELVFRSTGTGQDVSFSNQNGLAFWLISESGKNEISASSMDNFGGPLTFDGFQFLVNSKDYRGLKIFGGDGENPIKNSDDLAIGKCEFNYLDSLVPFTLRFSYSKEKSWFKVQLDNTLCFKTDKIKIPEMLNDFKFGVSASTDPSSKEIFEIFKVNVWSHLTQDAIDDHGLIAEGRIKYEVDQKEVKNENSVPPSYTRQSLMERNRAQQEQLRNDQLQVSSNNLMKQVLIKLEDIQGRMGSVLISGDAGSVPLENTIPLNLLAELKEMQARQAEMISEIKSELSALTDKLSPHFSEFLSSIAKQNEKLVDEVREYKYSSDQIGNKVDLLMAHHKEIAYQAEKDKKEETNSDLLPPIVRWVLIAVVIGITALIVIVYRLRHDIKHSKLL